MTDLLNPYAPPAAELRTATDEHCWRDGKLVVLRAGHDLPPRCVCCNAAATPVSRPRRLSWHTPWLYLLILLNILIYIVVALLARRTVKLHPALCPRHARERRRGHWTGLALLVLGLLILFAGVASDDPAYSFLRQAQFVLGALTLLGMLWVFSRLPANLGAARIDRGEVRVRGAGELFLASLPPYVGLPPSGLR